MTQPTSPYTRIRPTDGTSDPRPVSTRVPPIPDPPEPPEPTDIDAELFAKAALLMGSQPVIPNPALQALAAHRVARDALVQDRLDAFREQTTAMYATREGRAQLSPPFHMGEGITPPENRQLVASIARGLGMSDSEILYLQVGRGKPDQIRRVTQSLIDAGRLPSPATGLSLADRVRIMMRDHGVGLDCAGYVAQAFSASREGESAGALLRSRRPDTERLADLSSRGFSRLPLGLARPGDLVILGKPPNESVGHTAIVYAAREATPEDRAFLAVRINERNKVDPNRPELQAIASARRLHVIVVDSSWGDAGDWKHGGVERRSWWNDESTGKWGWTDTAGMGWVTNQPCFHPVEGVYRPTSEP